MIKPLPEKERLVWMIFSAVLLLGSLLINSRLRAESTHSAQRLKILLQREADLKNEISQLNWTLNKAQAAGLTDSAIGDFKKKGLKQPVADLFSDLRKHPELIPDKGTKGTMGGRRGFYLPYYSRIINDRWVLGVFENGSHIGGESLLRYKVTTEGTIHWKLVDAWWRDTRTKQSGEHLVR